ncbi:MAG: reverse transcriptase domain-containing protein [Alkaliphilus sp.]|nr:reverse transcriptase domain-containing protein [Alkaliphilus sp.]
METKLTRIAEKARKDPELKFTTLVHLINEETLECAHKSMPKGKAPGIDGVSKAEYEKDLEANIKDLVARMKMQAYKPQAVRRTYIPKSGSSKMRPLGIPAYEDKLVQVVMVRILNAIYEQDFLDLSYGFRPNRNCHDALKALNAIIENRPINYIVDADIKGFFDNVDHKWLEAAVTEINQKHKQRLNINNLRYQALLVFFVTHLVPHCRDLTYILLICCSVNHLNSCICFIALSGTAVTYRIAALLLQPTSILY